MKREEERNLMLNSSLVMEYTSEQPNKVFKNEKNKNKRVAICKYYQNGNCRHGISGKKEGICKFEHPKGV